MTARDPKQFKRTFFITDEKAFLERVEQIGATAVEIQGIALHPLLPKSVKKIMLKPMFSKIKRFGGPERAFFEIQNPRLAEMVSSARHYLE